MRTSFALRAIPSLQVCACLKQSLTPSRLPRRRWRIAFLLAFGVIIGFFDRINLSVSQDALHASFGLSLIAFRLPCQRLQLDLRHYADACRNSSGPLRRSPRRPRQHASSGASPPLLRRFLRAWACSLLPACFSASPKHPRFPATRKPSAIGFPNKSVAWPSPSRMPPQSFPPRSEFPSSACCCCTLDGGSPLPPPGFLSLLYFALFYLFYRNPHEDTNYLRRTSTTSLSARRPMRDPSHRPTGLCFR